MNSDIYKIAVIGGPFVGKTALITQLVKDYFVEDYEPTIQDIYSKELEVLAKPLWIHIIDTAGQEEFLSSSAALLIENISIRGLIMVYDVTERSSFQEIEILKNKFLSVKTNPRLKMILVANKCDLKEERQVTSLEGQEFANLLSCTYIETSAKTKTNVENVFISISTIIKDSEPKPKPGKH